MRIYLIEYELTMFPLLLCVSECTAYSPAATTVFLIFLLFESLLFGIFTAIMFGTQMCNVCSDETVSQTFY